MISLTLSFPINQNLYSNINRIDYELPSHTNCTWLLWYKKKIVFSIDLLHLMFTCLGALIQTRVPSMVSTTPGKPTTPKINLMLSDCFCIRKKCNISPHNMWFDESCCDPLGDSWDCWLIQTILPNYTTASFLLQTTVLLTLLAHLEEHCDSKYCQMHDVIY